MSEPPAKRRKCVDARAGTPVHHDREEFSEAENVAERAVAPLPDTVTKHIDSRVAVPESDRPASEDPDVRVLKHLDAEIGQKRSRFRQVLKPADAATMKEYVRNPKQVVAQFLRTLNPAWNESECNALFDTRLASKVIKLDNARRIGSRVSGTSGGSLRSSSSAASNAKLTVEETQRIARRRRRRRQKLPQDLAQYSLYEPLRVLWRAYAEVAVKHTREVRQAGANADFCAQVSRLDLHGAELRVIRSKNPTLVGLVGTVLSETRQTVLLVTRANQYKRMAKQDCVFAVEVARVWVRIFGQHFNVRTHDRVSKKLKGKPTIELL
ncbi:MAG: hypothetical protein MHM6MM_001860 [Cercozoa sp. M6MM]